jgi:hypothetical protein
LGVKETDITNRSQIAVSPLGAVLWKNVRGVFRQLRSEAKIKVGVGPNGASDALGYRKIVITHAMIGMTIAQFLAIEFKTEDGVERKDQEKFIQRVIADGGCAGFARSENDAVNIVRSEIRKNIT